MVFSVLKVLSWETYYVNNIHLHLTILVLWSLRSQGKWQMEETHSITFFIPDSSILCVMPASVKVWKTQEGLNVRSYIVLDTAVLNIGKHQPLSKYNVIFIYHGMSEQSHKLLWLQALLISSRLPNLYTYCVHLIHPKASKWFGDKCHSLSPRCL